MEKLLDRFIKFVKIDTMSNESSQKCPSSDGQLELAKIIKEEMDRIGFDEAFIDQYGYVYGKINSNTDKIVDPIGFISHLDTSPDITAKNVRPLIIENYSGGDILLNPENNIILRVEEHKELKKFIGDTIITTDGTTLLGADDKAGIAEILTAMEEIINNKELKHGDIYICFNPDEEIGRGSDKFNLNYFKANFAFTVDGGAIGELEFENFNASSAEINIKGKGIHPGYAKNKMINSLLIANEIINNLPKNEIPAKTSKYQGFYHILSFSGNVEETTMKLILRDFSEKKLKDKENKLKKIIENINKKYNEDLIQIKITEQYKNMAKIIKPRKKIINLAINAYKNNNIKPIIKAVRGGTDGAKLTYMGLPCPNIFTGGYNFHSRYEFIPLNSMKKAVSVIIDIVRLNYYSS